MKHYVIGLLILVCTAGVHTDILRGQARASSAVDHNPDLNLPERINSYRKLGDDIDPGDEVRRVLETSSILMRNYISPSGVPILVTLVYAGVSRRSLHFPEVCLVGQGWEIEKAYTAPVGMEFRAKRIVIFRGSQKQAVTYWFKTGDSFTGSPFINALYWGKEQLKSGSTSSTMIKLSMPFSSKGGFGEEQAFAALDDLALRMAPILREKIK